MGENGKKAPKGFLLAALIIFLFLVPILTHDPYKLGILIRIGIFSTLALGVRLVLLSGQLTLGHAAIWAVGGYSSALMVMKLGIPVWIAFFLSGFIASLVGLIIGYPTLRIKGIYFAIITLAFAELAEIIILNQPELLGGAMGIRGIPTFGSIGEVVFHDFFPWAYYYVALIMALLTALIMWRIDHSRLGRTITAVREDDELAESIGVNLMKYKMIAFVAACFFAGLAGSFWAHYYRFLHPSLFTVWDSIYMLIYVVIGGVGSAMGPIIGTASLLIISELLVGALEWRAVIYAVVLITIIFTLPRGILGLPQALSSLYTRYAPQKQKDQR